MRDGEHQPRAGQAAADDAAHEHGERGATADVGEHGQAARGAPARREARAEQQGDRRRGRPPRPGRAEQHGGAGRLEQEDRQVGDRDVGRVTQGRGGAARTERAARLRRQP
jgi:hypothetical protein